MKTPRVHDFDPDAKVPELGSPLDNLPAIQKPQQKQLLSHTTLIDNKIKPTKAYESPPVRSYARTPVRRQLTRYAFEFYQDQVEELRHLSLEEKMQGEKGSMSEMVREAIDGYLAKKKSPNE
jgi:hypothetical protein